MVRGTRSTRFTGSALVRLLAQLAEADAPASKQAFAERLSHWLGWTDAISLSAALNASLPKAPGSRAVAVDPEEAEFTRVRSALVQAIAEDTAPPVERRPAGGRAAAPTVPPDDEADFTLFRRRYVTRQQAMESSIAPLRGRVRAALAARSPALARLAAVDAVMEQAVGPRERTLLSCVPVLLEKRFRMLRQAQHAGPQGWAVPSPPPAGVEETRGGPAFPQDASLANTAPASAPTAWLAQFRLDMRAILMAELDIRLQPVEGLLDTLRKKATLPP